MVYAAKLEIITIQNGDSDKTVATGSVTVSRGSVYIEFGEDGSKKTCIGISSGIVTITKFGEDSYTFILEEGKKTGTTAIFGDFKADLSIQTKTVTFNEKPDGFKLKLVYALSFNDNNLIENVVTVKCTYLNEGLN